MVAYSFHKQFVHPIEIGTKQQTIRKLRKGQARAGSGLQLYVGQRTRSCRLIGIATCIAVRPVLIDVRGAAVFYRDACDQEPDVEAFARRDGFLGWWDLEAFWAAHHPDVAVFTGDLIVWGDTFQPPALDV